MKSRKFLYVLPFLLLCSCASRTYFINQKSYTEDAHTDIIKVTFSYENGEEDSYENLNRGDKISEIKNPVRSGYEFLGWYFDDSPWDFKTGVVSTNMTLTANWIGKRDNSKKHAILENDSSSIKFDFEFYENNTTRQINSLLQKKDLSFLSTDSVSLKLSNTDAFLIEDEKNSLLPLEIGMKNGKELIFPLTKQEDTWTSIGRIVSKSLVETKMVLENLKTDTLFTLTKS